MEFSNEQFLADNLAIFGEEGLTEVIKTLNEQFLKGQQASFQLETEGNKLGIFLDVEGKERISFSSFHDLEIYLIHEYTQAHIVASETLLQEGIVSQLGNINSAKQDVVDIMKAIISVASNDVNAGSKKMQGICKVYARETAEILRQRRIDNISPAKLKLYNEAKIVDAEGFFGERHIEVLHKLIQTSEKAIDLDKLCKQSVVSILTFIAEKGLEFTLDALQKTTKGFDDNIENREYWGTPFNDGNNLAKYVE